ncbi:MAG: DUF2946 family protein [Burkholderiaceae bacterium]|jgi:hypothetical protein
MLPRLIKKERGLTSAFLVLAMVFTAFFHSGSAVKKAQSPGQQVSFCSSSPIDLHAMPWLSQSGIQAGEEQGRDHCPFCHLPIISNLYDSLARAFNRPVSRDFVLVTWDFPSPQSISVQNASRAPPPAKT